MPKDTYKRACEGIRHYVLYSGTQIRFGVGTSDRLDYKNAPLFSDAKPVKGDLVRIQFTRPTKWDLSWFDSVIHDGFKLESIEDRDSCNWTNIDVVVFDRDAVEKNPQWRWSDGQFKIWDWIVKAYSSKSGLCPVRPVFDGDRVQLGTRRMFSSEIITDGLFFEDWRKLKYRDVVAFRDGKIKGDGSKVGDE